MRIGKLNRRIDILEFVVMRNEYGEEVGTWTKKESVWAKIEPISGTEYFKSQKPVAENTTTITIRYNKNISVLNRIKYQNKLYEIIGVSDDETLHTTTILNCKEKVAYGV